MIEALMVAVGAYTGHVVGKWLAYRKFYGKPKLGSDYKCDDDLVCRLKREAKQRGEGIVG